MNKIYCRVMSTFYLVVLAISLPMLWCTSLLMRVGGERLTRCGLKRKVQLLRVLAKHATRDLGSAVIWFMAVPSAIAGAYSQALSPAAVGAAVGLLAMALLPVVAPMPSRQLADAAATGRRFV